MIKYKWEINKDGYISGYFNGKKNYAIHKAIMNPPKGFEVDHINGNKLDNRRENLRICTKAQNAKNKAKTTSKTLSQYKGVSWDRKSKKWSVEIKSDKERFYIGLFSDEDCAANAYNYYAKIYHGEFARLNDCPFITKDVWEANKAKVKKTSKYRGVSWNENLKKWTAKIDHNNKQIYLGVFENEKEAALAYNQKALELKGNKAKLNII